MIFGRDISYISVDTYDPAKINICVNRETHKAIFTLKLESEQEKILSDLFQFPKPLIEANKILEVEDVSF